MSCEECQLGSLSCPASSFFFLLHVSPPPCLLRPESKNDQKGQKGDEDHDNHQVIPLPQCLPHPLLGGDPVKEGAGAGNVQGGDPVQEGDDQLQQLLRQISQSG